VAAERAAELGLKVACVERAALLGGVCLREGCIPSKALLDSSEHYAFARGHLAEHGVRVGEASLDLAALQARKQRVVEKLAEDVRGRLARRRVEVVPGTARLASPGAVEVAGAAGSRMILRAGRVLLATGSEPAALPQAPFDGRRVVSSAEAVAFDSVPDHLVIVGAGYIGLELGSVWARLGARVTVIEALPRVAPYLDGQAARALERSLRKQGLELRTDTRLAAAAPDGEGLRLTLDGAGAGEVRCDRLLVAVGRRPLTRGLGLEEAGVALDPATGRVRVDVRYRTTAPGVYAIGDLVDGPMLAHKASAEGLAAAQGMAGLACDVNYDAIPSVIYTSPEVASAGLTEEQLKARGVPYKAGTFPFAGAPRAWCAGETEGFAKVLAHGRSGRLLGVHIIGPRASELIAEAVLALEHGLTAADLIRAVHAHPTLSEALREAAAKVAT
jgi:dihydrolipoamide dehydrogenase